MMEFMARSCRRIAAVILGAAVCYAAGADATSAGPTTSLSGLTGLIRVPDAGIAPDQMARVSWTSAMRTPNPSMGSTCTRVFGFSLMPRTEEAFSLGHYTGASGKEGWDLVAHLKVQIAAQEGSRPSVAVGVVDLGRNGARSGTRFAVGTWDLDGGRLSATVGAADGTSRGLLAGMQWRPVPYLKFQGEYDTRRTNWGVVAYLGERAFVRAASLSSGTIVTAGYALALNGPPAAGAQRASHPPAPSSNASLDQVRDELAGLGLEDVRVRLEEDGAGRRALVASFENRRYTLIEQDALRDVLAAMEGGARDVAELVVRFQRRGLTIAEYRVPVEAFQRYVAGQIGGSELRARGRASLLPGENRDTKAVAASDPANPSAGHADVLVGPGLRTTIGTEEGEFKYGLYLRPEIVLPLGRGLLAHGAWQAPIAGDLTQNEPKRWSTYRSTLAYVLKPAPGWLAQVVAGRCPGSVDAAVIEAVRLTSGHGFIRFTGGWADSDLLRRRPYVVGEYWHLIPRWNVQVRLVGGRFLSGDKALGLDIVRQFAATEIAVGARKSSSHDLFLVRVSVPLSPRRQPQRPQTARIRLPDQFDHTVRTLAERSNYLHLLPLTSVELDLGQSLRDAYLSRGRLMPEHRSWLEW